MMLMIKINTINIVRLACDSYIPPSPFLECKEKID